MSAKMQYRIIENMSSSRQHLCSMYTHCFISVYISMFVWLHVFFPYLFFFTVIRVDVCISMYVFERVYSLFICDLHMYVKAE